MSQYTQPSRPTYQLTSYPSGSLLEIFHISLPLILGLLSASVMLFTDRWLLSRYSVDALNAATTSGTAAYSIIILTMSIASISGVFAGRYHGESNLKEIGKPVWQMIWYSLFLFPLCAVIGLTAPSYIFWNTPLFQSKTEYFSTLMYFTPVFSLNMAIAGFFTGTGKLNYVLYSHLAANILNIIFDVIFINGYGPIPSFGIIGAAVATGISETIAIFLLSAIFFHPENRIRYGTFHYALDFSLLWRSIQIGFPIGLGISIQMLSIFIVYQFIESSGKDEATIASLAQSIFFLVMCLSDGLSKGVIAVSSNLLGAGRYDLINKLLKSSCLLLVVFYFLATALILPFTSIIIDLFFTETEEASLISAAFLTKTYWTFFIMTIYFLLDGLAKVFSAQLTAAGDSKFILLANIALSLLTMLLPVYIALLYLSLGVIAGWSIFTFFSLCSLLVYFSRYMSNCWKTVSDNL